MTGEHQSQHLRVSLRSAMSKSEILDHISPTHLHNKIQAFCIGLRRFPTIIESCQPNAFSQSMFFFSHLQVKFPKNRYVDIKRYIFYSKTMYILLYNKGK